MRLMIGMLLLALLGIPAMSEEAPAADVFLERAGVEADAALRDKIDDFLDEKGLTPRIINMMDPELARRYAKHLSAGLPIDYEYLLKGETAPLPEDVDFTTLRQLAVLHPEGAATPSLLADFERGLIYYDSAWPVPTDVCRAGGVAELTDEAAGKLLEVLTAAGLENWDADYPGNPAAGVNLLALGFDSGVVRYTAAALSEAPESQLDALLALLSLGAELTGSM